MPVIIAMLIGGLVQAAGSFLGRMLISAGIGFISYKGFSVLLGKIKTAVFQNLDGLPDMAIGVLYTLKFDVAINIIFSAILIKYLIKGMQSDTFKRFTLK